MRSARATVKKSEQSQPDEEMWRLDQEMVVARGEAIAELLEQIVSAPYTLDTLDRLRALTVLSLRMSTAALKRAADDSTVRSEQKREYG